MKNNLILIAVFSLLLPSINMADELWRTTPTDGGGGYERALYDQGLYSAEGAGPGIIAFEVDPTVVMENAGRAYVHVLRIGGTDGDVSVYYSAKEGTALLGTDFSGSSGVLTWASGAYDRKVIEIPIVDNFAHAVDKYFEVLLTTPTGGATIGGHNPVKVVINNDDLPDMNVGFDLHAGLGQTLSLAGEAIEPVFGTLQTLWKWKVPVGYQMPTISPVEIADPHSLTTTIQIRKPGRYEIVLMGDLGHGYVETDSLIISAGDPSSAPLLPSVNLFNPSKGGQAVIFYRMNETGRIQIRVYDRNGREIVELINSDHSAGDDSVYWDGRDSGGEKAAPGVYPVVIKEGSGARTIKLVVVR